MSKIKYFLTSIFQSATNPKYYKEVVKARAFSSIKYLSLLILLASFLSLVIPLIALLPTLPKALSEIEKLYPENLEIKLDKGQVSTNLPEPYYLVNEKDGVIIIDTTGNTQDIPEGRAGVLITKNKIITKDANGIEERTYNLSTFKDSLTINREVFSSLLSKLRPLLFPLILLAAIILYPLIFSSIFFIDLVYISFITLIPLILSKVLSLNFNFKNLFKISIHAYTLPLLLQFFVTRIFKIAFPPFSFSLIYLAFITTILVSLNNSKER